MQESASQRHLISHYNKSHTSDSDVTEENGRRLIQRHSRWESDKNDEHNKSVLPMARRIHNYATIRTAQNNRLKKTQNGCRCIALLFL